MKRVLFLAIIFCYFQNLQSQTEPNTIEKKVIDSTAVVINSSDVEVKPEFPGGVNLFYKFVANNFNMPDTKGGINGKIVVSFVVEKDGSLSDFKILKDIGYGAGEEAIRVLKRSPKWTPAMQGEKLVRCNYVIPITLNFQ